MSKRDKLMSRLQAMMNDFVVGKISPETIELVLGGLNHDTDVADAENLGEVRGKNLRHEERLSALGREFLENMLIGKGFEGSPDVVRMLTAIPSMRQKVVMALGEIVDNVSLGEAWTLQSQLADAVRLCYEARTNGKYKEGDKVSPYSAQGILFADPDELQTVADLNNVAMLMLADVLNDRRVKMLSEILLYYNDEARPSSIGQTDMFAGGVRSREDILREAIIYYIKKYGNKEELERARRAAVERRKAASTDEDGTPPASRGESGQGNAAAASGHAPAGEGEPAPVGEEARRPSVRLTEKQAEAIVAEMEGKAETPRELELTPDNWDNEFGNDGIVKTPLGNVKMGEHQYLKLAREGRNGKLGMVKPTLEHPDIIIEDASTAKEGDTSERNSSYVFVKAFKKADGTRYYYFTSITVSKDGMEVVVSNQEKSRNRILRLMTEGNVVWRTPKDATASSAEKQGLDYAQPETAEAGTKGSGITPQSTPSGSKGSEKSASEQEKSEKTAENEPPSEGKPESGEPQQEQDVEPDTEETGAGYTITPTTYTTKRGKVLNLHLVKFDRELTKEEKAAAKELAKADKGWWSREHGGWLMRSEEAAQQLAETIAKGEEAVADAQPLLLDDMAAASDQPQVAAADEQGTEPKQDEQTEQPAEGEGTQPPTYTERTVLKNNLAGGDAYINIVGNPESGCGTMTTKRTPTPTILSPLAQRP